MMNGKKKKPVVPRLRFPEFRDAGEWEEYKIGDLLSLEYGGSLPEGSRQDGPIPVIGSNGIVGFHDEFLITGPAIVVGRKGSVGEVNWIESDCYPIDTTFYVTSKNSSNLLVFLKLLLEKASLPRLGDNGAVPGLNRNDVYTLKTALPAKGEQQKIADCLSSLDELIALQSQKVETLKQHKKGLMQQLFPREGETTPRLRFPEFRDAGEWEVITIGKLGRVSMCKRVMKHETKEKGDIPFYKIGTFGNTADAFISRKLFEKYKRKYPFPKEGDILISAAGTIGRLVVYDGADAYFQDSNIVWIDNDERLVINPFLFYCYNNINWRTDDNTIARLYNDNLRRIKISIPSPPEQQKIADCLSSLDELIELQSQKVEALKQHKRGLMQQLFPQEVA